MILPLDENYSSPRQFSASSFKRHLADILVLQRISIEDAQFLVPGSGRHALHGLQVLNSLVYI